jgi:hypothetical protein
MAVRLTLQSSDGCETNRFLNLHLFSLNVISATDISCHAGSPFHPKVVDPRKVHLAGSWESVVDMNNQLRLKLNELKTLEFDTRLAGPGKFFIVYWFRCTTDYFDGTALFWFRLALIQNTSYVSHKYCWLFICIR